MDLLNALRNNWHQFRCLPSTQASTLYRMSRLHSLFLYFLITQHENIWATLQSCMDLKEATFSLWWPLCVICRVYIFSSLNLFFLLCGLKVTWNSNIYFQRPIRYLTCSREKGYKWSSHNLPSCTFLIKTFNHCCTSCVELNTQ